jgi:ribosome-associated heat shock protein Hsp15
MIYFRVMEKLRLDKYLWAIRVFKTRSAASEACDKGKVKADGLSAKAARPVRIGEQYEVKTDTRRWVVKVTGLLEKRVQFSEAVKFYEDLTPVEEKERLAFQAAVFYSGKRQTKIGRPTKKQRRDLEGFMDDDLPVPSAQPTPP